MEKNPLSAPGIFVVAAVDAENGMGFQGRLPWSLPEELRVFAHLTTRTDKKTALNRVIMGRKTWDSLPASHRPLPHRENVVLSRASGRVLPGAQVVSSLEEAVALPLVTIQGQPVEKTFLIGGRHPIAEITNPHNPLFRHLRGIYLTRIHHRYPCDVFFPPLEEGLFQKTRYHHIVENNIEMEFFLYVPI